MASALMKRKFNIRFFLCLLVAIFVVGLGFHGVHLLQAQRTASGLLRLADQAEAKGDLPKAGDYLWRFLKLVPDNREALVRFGLMLDSQATAKPGLRQRALDVLEKVLRHEPDRADLRRKVVHLAISMRSYVDAKAHLTVLLAETPNDGELWHLMGVCETAAGNTGEAIKALEKAKDVPAQQHR